MLLRQSISCPCAFFVTSDADPQLVATLTTHYYALWSTSKLPIFNSSTCNCMSNFKGMSNFNGMSNFKLPNIKISTTDFPNSQQKNVEIINSTDLCKPNLTTTLWTVSWCLRRAVRRGQYFKLPDYSVSSFLVPSSTFWKSVIWTSTLRRDTLWLTHQGCQIFLGTTYQNGEKYTKWHQNVPNGHEIHEMAKKYV
jgi:hypothetical protein